MRKFIKISNSKIINIAIIFGLTALLISVATYAWYIGMRTVNISSFDIEIATTESLLISLDGKTWSNEVIISEANHDKTYPGNTNSWGGKGLIPLSSIGEVSQASSRLIFYEKASLTASPGGFRLLASRVNNSGAKEQEGYVVFDIFIKNFSGQQYFKNLNILDEEAVYLTIDSEAGIAASGVPSTGIENSVRVAFAHIGRVIAKTTNPSTITSITCSDTDEVTGICRNAPIWEPNDKYHHSNAISWYNTVCKKRVGLDVRNPKSYTGSCNPIQDGTAYPTYAVNSPIILANNVDVYDGAAYNGYTNSNKLTDVAYFTDTMRDKSGVNRQEIFTLAPNSITKIRVYIYIEGQDIDNYEYASLGKKIEVQFGFTKERFSASDFYYEAGEAGIDIWNPVISIDPDIREITINQGETFTVPTATAIDKISEDLDGNDFTEDITRKIQIINPVDTNIPGIYYVTYNVSDWAGNYAEQIMIAVTVV
ncbi:MAG: DUF5011 domain-containing protein [Bacilli bacterium]|nr:DUF5011 domain-containing protein [Bacilli bacterium]